MGTPGRESGRAPLKSFRSPSPLGSFVETDIIAIYSKILTDVLERTEGVPDDVEELMWDNCMQSNSCYGLITMLSKAMADKTELFLVYEKAVNVIQARDSRRGTADQGRL